MYGPIEHWRITSRNTGGCIVWIIYRKNAGKGYSIIVRNMSRGGKNGIKEILFIGYATVPVRHDLPAGKTMKLAVAVFPCRGENPAPDPLVLNTAGPGKSNMDNFFPALASDLGAVILSTRDVVLIELRGLRYSEHNLICKEVADAQIEMMTEHLSYKESKEILAKALSDSKERLMFKEKSNIPVLVLNGLYDSVIPPKYDAEMKEYLGNCHIYRFDGVTHSVVDNAPGCGIPMLLEFLQDPSKAPDSSCMQNLSMKFETGKMGR